MDTRFENYLLISDMDGTLINTRGEISKENISAINNFVKKGGIFTIATGRTMESAGRYLKQLQVNAPIVLYNGAKIYDYKKEKTLCEISLEEPVKEIIRKVKYDDSSLGLEIYCEENVYIYNPCRFTERFSKKGYEIYYNIEDIWDKNWTKILILGEENQLDVMEIDFIDTFGDVNLIRSGENFLEIIPKNTSKGHGLIELCKILRTDLSNTIAVGDNMNDAELLKEAGYGFCVANGNKKLRDIVKYKCPSNDEAPIKYIVEWIERTLL
ncbi:HAD family hydrolase [Clostridium pasteurianum]|uniref:HAD family hydrolase n=1 Tax=Clostridium pasteurianum TaxID=1501 RepID=UPI002260A593|nr:HAD family hydrolase [Clostridium pasteurianum]UZW13331.1 HAD family hydrolase [Clostridium pasteurianum]